MSSLCTASGFRPTFSKAAKRCSTCEHWAAVTRTFQSLSSSAWIVEPFTAFVVSCHSIGRSVSRSHSPRQVVIHFRSVRTHDGVVPIQPIDAHRQMPPDFILDHGLELSRDARRKLEYGGKHRSARNSNRDVLAFQLVPGEHHRQGPLHQGLLFFLAARLFQAFLVFDAQGDFQLRLPTLFIKSQLNGLETVGTDIDTPGGPPPAATNHTGDEVGHADRLVGPQVQFDGRQSQSLQGQAAGHAVTAAALHSAWRATFSAKAIRCKPVCHSNGRPNGDSVRTLAHGRGIMPSSFSFRLTRRL